MTSAASFHHDVPTRARGLSAPSCSAAPWGRGLAPDGGFLIRVVLPDAVAQASAPGPDTPAAGQASQPIRMNTGLECAITPSYRAVPGWRAAMWLPSPV